MRKYSKIIIVVAIIVLTGILVNLIVNTRDNKVKCTMTNNEKNYTITYNYIIKSKKNIVVSEELQETVSSKNNTVLAYFKKQLDDRYKDYKSNYKGYEYSIEDKKGEFVLTSKIDFTKIDLNKYTSENATVKETLNKEKKISSKKYIEMYKTSGYTCK